MTDSGFASTLNRRGLFRMGGVGALALGSASFLAACGSNSDTSAPPAAPTTVSGSDSAASATYDAIDVQLSWIKNIEFSGEYWAIEKGYYTEQGIQGMSTSNLLANSGSTTAVVGLCGKFTTSSFGRGTRCRHV